MQHLVASEGLVVNDDGRQDARHHRDFACRAVEENYWHPLSAREIGADQEEANWRDFELMHGPSRKGGTIEERRDKSQTHSKNSRRGTDVGNWPRSKARCSPV